MIQIKNKIGSAVPDILTSKGVAATNQLKADFDNGTIKFEIDPKIYGDKSVKEKLSELQNNKCCFCESKIGHISYGDVEHFRPKGGWVQENETINTPGYYWLAYHWDNLLLSCSICNQRHKKNHFPLLPNSKRALNHNCSIVDEQPIFIHPVTENPENFIEFNEEVAVSIDDMRGKTTIEKLGLNRPLLNEERKSKLDKIKDIYILSQNTPVFPPEIKQTAISIISSYFEESKKDETEYASMLRSFFRKNPIDF